MDTPRPQRFFGLPLQPRPTITIDELENGEKVYAVLQKLDIPGNGAAQSLAKCKIGEYVPLAMRYGDISIGLEKMPGEMPFPPVGGEWVKVSQDTCLSCAFMCEMQIQDNPYSFEELVAMSKVCPKSFIKMVAAVNELGEDEKKAETNSNTASSDAPQVEGSPTTP